MSVPIVMPNPLVELTHYGMAPGQAPRRSGQLTANVRRQNMGLLQRIFRSSYGRRIEHPVLGEALLIRAKKGAYWEVETEVAQKAFTVSIEAPDEAEPSQQQVEFFERFAKNPNLAFSRVQSLLVAEYEKWVRKPFPNNWTDAFEFVGMSVPVAADERNPWELSFECLQDRERHLFTCTFERGAPRGIQIDG